MLKFKNSFVCLLMTVAVLCPAVDGAAQPIMSDPLIQSVLRDQEEVRIIRGELTTVDVKTLQRVSVGDPDIVDIVSAEGEELVIIGKAQGKTPLFVWDDNGRRTINVYVVEESLEELQARIEQLLAAGGIKGVQVIPNPNERMVMVVGKVDRNKRENFDKLIEPFEDDGFAIIAVDPTQNEDLVQVDMQITEISSTLFRKIGVDWFTGDVTRSEETLLGQTFINQVTTVNEDDTFAPDFVEALPIFNDSDDVFNAGSLFRSQALVARINAQVENGRARVLSNPKLVVVSGEEASFLVGGEVPIRTTNTNENGVSENVEFKEYGVGMTITPTVKESGKVDIILNLDISDIDRSNATADDLAFTVRTAQTRLLLDDGETVVLAGLIKNAESETIRKVPYLAEVPILGLLFRSKRTPTADQDMEIVLSMTPHLIIDEKPVPAAPKSSQTRSVSSPVVPVKVDPMKGMADYLQSVQKLIARSVVYPSEAADLGWEGTVTVNMMILSDGTLAFALVEESSGYDLIDRSALSLVKGLSYPAFPAGAQKQEISLSVPIVYSQSR